MMPALRTRVLLTALLMAGTLGLTGCGATGSGTAKTSAKAPAAAGDGSGHLRFASTTLDGEPFKGSSLAGKPSVLWFWAPWCGTCRGQAAHTAKLAATYKNKVNFLGVAGLDRTKPIRAFVKAEKVGDFPHLDDQKGTVWKKFGITQQSSFVLLDKNGRTVHEGVPASPAQLDKLVAGLAG